MSIQGAVAKNSSGLLHESKSQIAAGQSMLLCAILCLIQAMDGVFTSIGIQRFGVAMEGNPLLRSLMEQFGCIPTLGAVKLLAIIAIIGISLYASYYRWINNALRAVMLTYFFAAILPWTYILFLS